MDARETAVCRCNVGSLKSSPAKHVEACGESDSGQGFNSPRLHFLELQPLSRDSKNSHVIDGTACLIVNGLAYHLPDRLKMVFSR